MVQYIKSTPEFASAMEASKEKLVVIDFTATWCPPCRMIGPIFEMIAEENPDIACFKVDVDDASDVASDCGISAMPTFQFYKNGEKVDELCGASEDLLREKIKAQK